jgi:hypothetical protein
MTVSTLTLRQTKGARLTTVEMDNNWLYCSDSSNATFAQSGTGAHRQMLRRVELRNRRVQFRRLQIGEADEQHW